MKVKLVTLCQCEKIIPCEKFPGHTIKVPLMRPIIPSEWWDIRTPITASVIKDRSFVYVRKTSAYYIYREQYED